MAYYFDPGGCQTYQRRYLYLCATDLVEADSFDASAPIKEEKIIITPTQGAMDTIPEDEQNYLRELAMELIALCDKEEQAAFDGVTKEEFESTINALIEQFESRINALNSEKAQLSAQVEKMSKQPATESVKKVNAPAASAPINLAKMDSKNRIFSIINKYK